MPRKFLLALIPLAIWAQPPAGIQSPAALAGTIRNVKFNLPAITFTFVDTSPATWNCKGGTPDDMEAGGWHALSMRGAGTVTIQPIAVGQDKFSVKAVSSANGRILLPKPPIKTPAPAVVCTLQTGATK